MANLGASGISVANSGYGVIDQWLTENERPSLLTVVQLSSSILFFGHAVYNFQMAESIIDESQTGFLRQFQDTLYGNRQRKMFNEMLETTIKKNDGDVQKGRAEVIKTIRNIQNMSDVAKQLNQVKNIMDDMGVHLSADRGDIKLNGVTIDMAQFTRNLDTEVVTFLPAGFARPSRLEVNSVGDTLKRTIQGISGLEIATLAYTLLQILGGSSHEDVKSKIVSAVAAVINQLLIVCPNLVPQLDTLFPRQEKYFQLVTMVNGFFQVLVDDAEKKYQEWQRTKDPQVEAPYFSQLSLEKANRSLEIFQHLTDIYFTRNGIQQKLLEEMIDYFYTWFAKQICLFEEKHQRKQQRNEHGDLPSSKVTCSDCGGHYYR